MHGIANDMMDDIMKYSSGATNTNIEDLQNDYKTSNQIEFSGRLERNFIIIGQGMVGNRMCFSRGLVHHFGI